jgi:hypothetical protein
MILREQTIREGRPAIRWVLACAHGQVCFEEEAADAHAEAVIALLELIPAHDDRCPEACTDALWDRMMGLDGPPCADPCTWPS